MKRITTHCALRLGDGLAAVHFLRHLSLLYPDIRFTHYCHAHYALQLEPVLEGVNVELKLLNVRPGEVWWESKPEGQSFDLWKNAGHFWETHPDKNNYALFMMTFFKKVSDDMGLECPIQTPHDLLFDYPALKMSEPTVEPFDFLVINAAPMSNQAQFYQAHEMEDLVRALARKYKVITTNRTRLPVLSTESLGLSVTEIGKLSQQCKYIIMVSTGPSWPTFNIFNTESIKLRIILIDFEFIGLSENTVQKHSAGAARQVLEWKGLL